MYESFYGFDQRPFLTVPTLERYFPASSIEQAYQTVARAVQRCEGPVAIFGGAGLGKTMCCLRIAASIPQNFEVVTLASSQVITRRALLQSLLYELRMPYRDWSEGELRLNLLERLQPSDENPSQGLVLIVDEAQTLSVKLLEELRILTNVVRNGVPRLRLVLCGTMKLEEHLTHPHLESLNQRLAARCYLTPLSHQECDRYVQHKVELSGVQWDHVISTDGLEAIYRASDGIPRLIDQVADQALLVGAKEKLRPINASVVGYAWSILQQLPNPWSEPTQDFSSSTERASHAVDGDSDDFLEDEESTSEFGECAIEFGALDEPPETEYFVATAPETTDVMASEQPATELNPRTVSDKITENLLACFTEGFDDEFRIPIQSLDGYQPLSGIALGDLNNDTLAFEESQQSIEESQIEEAESFVDLRLDRAHPLTDLDAQNVLYSSGNESEIGAIEQQIEDEMRDLVSNLNLSAMTLERDDSNRIDFSAIEDDTDMLVEAAEPSSSGTVHYQTPDGAGISFAYLQDGNVQGSYDDRDMILIDEELSDSKGTSSVPSDMPSKATIHPYARLFSQLRTS